MGLVSSKQKNEKIISESKIREEAFKVWKLLKEENGFDEDIYEYQILLDQSSRGEIKNPKMRRGSVTEEYLPPGNNQKIELLNFYISEIMILTIELINHYKDQGYTVVR